MSRVVDVRIAGLLERSEEAGTCLVLTEPAEPDAEALRRALSRRVANGAVVSPARGLFADADTWSGLGPSERALWLARGLQARHPGWVFCGPTAALAYGLDVSETLLGSTHVARTPGHCGTGSAGVTRHPVLGACRGSAAGGIEEGDTDVAGVEVVGGLRVTPPLQTVFDCLRWTDFPRGLGVVDSALRCALVGRDELAGYAESAGARRPRDAGRVLGTLSWADPRSENGGESVARGRMLLLGYARPELQVEVPRVIEGGQPWRADFCWVRADGRVVLGELDGRGKYVERELMGGRSIDEVLSDENIRGSRFSLYDVALMRFRFGVTERPAEFARLLDEYGVPLRGSELALPEGAAMVPDWEVLRRRGN
ncbi:type IV toxin-antitoxin system AbiEi family antitoxin domain-containing protein [Olsenella profusa]|uniref:DUF559 domain-containing protein n=1 Tax=Olsenella profusa TaxID=138595 RepID=A0ABS2F454_9ACTN|nr:hypothetical protein [Olsenella profusa]MBM6775309.1 hypothetical protein [Olsenella profusa]